jgi:hypothetical protein
MTSYIGRLVKIGVSKETTRGAGANPTYVVPNVSFSFDDKVTKVRETSGIGYLSDSDAGMVVSRYGAGDLESEIRSSSFGLFLYNVMGSLTTTGAVDEAYTHAFSLSETNNHQSLCLTVEDANTKEQYRLAMIDTLEINATLEDVVKFTASFLSKGSDSSTATMATLSSESKFTKKHLSFKVADEIGDLASATGVSLKSLRLTVSKNTVTNDVLGTAEPEDIFNRQFSVEGEIQLNYTDETWKQYFTNGTYKAVEIKLTNTDEVIGAGSTNPSLTIQMPRVDFFEWQPDYTLDEVVTQTLTFKANRDVANSLAPISTCSLVNGVASY